MGTDELPVEADPSDTANVKSDSAPGAHGPISSSSIFLWQYEFEQSLINQQLQYQQQAVAMEISIKAAALQAVTGAAEVSKLLNRETDASVVDVAKELTSSPRRLIGEVMPRLPSPTLESWRSKPITASPIGLEEEGKEKESRQSTMQPREGRRSSRSKERRRSHRSRSCSKERRRRHNKSRSRSRERRRRHRSRSRSRERRGLRGSRSRSRERRGRPRSRSRSRGRRHESKSRRRRRRSRSWS